MKIEFDSEDSKAVTAVAALTSSLLSEPNIFARKLEKMEVVDAKEIKAPAPAKTPTPRPSRAKAKPAPVEEEIEDEDLEFPDEEFTDEAEEDEEEITADNLRALQAAKIDKHRPAIAAHYGKLGAKGLSSLAPENFQKMFDFLSKLK